MLPKDAKGNNVLYSTLLNDYEDMFITVKQWQTFHYSDIDRNYIYDSTNRIPVPDFVTNFERMLDRKPGLRPDVGCILDSQSRAAYFELSEDSIVEDKSLRYAEQLEALHIAHIVSYDWQNLWGWGGKHTLNKCLVDAIFFFQLSLVPTNRTTIVYKYVPTRIL